RVKDPAGVRGDLLVPGLVGHAEEDTVAREPRVVHEDVEVAGSGDERLRLLAVGYVRLEDARTDLLRHLLGLVLPRPIAQRHRRTGACQLARDRGADATRPTGDERRLPRQRAELARQRRASP